MKESPLKYRYFTFLYGFVLIVLLIPFLQSQFMLHREEALKGSFVYAQDVSGKWKTWHDASFQTGKENYLKENFGFRNTLVRLNNQIFYSFFKINRISGVVIGKEDYLYGSDYIFSYLGYNFIGEDSLRNTAIKLKRISDELDRRGKKLIVAIAPGTASLKQQFLPEKYDTVIRGKTNYDYFVKYANENQLNLIDFQAFFKIAMDTASYPMLPKYGTHWSSYGSYLSLDSLLRYISARTNVDLPKLILDSLEVVHEYRGADYDMGQALNLLYPLETQKMAYPILHSESDSNSRQLKTMVIADSFFWNLVNNKFTPEVIQNLQFYYYMIELFEWPQTGKKYVFQKNLVDEFDTSDLFILLFNESNLQFTFYSFIEHANAILFGDEKVKQTYRLIPKYMDAMITDPQWSESIRQKAAERNKTFEEMMIIDAKWMAEQEVY